MDFLSKIHDLLIPEALKRHLYDRSHSLKFYAREVKTDCDMVINQFINKIKQQKGGDTHAEKPQSKP